MNAPNYYEEQRLRLIDSTKRLLKLLDLNAPKVIIAREVSSVMLYGNSYTENAAINAFGKRIENYRRADAGYCMSCEGNPRLAEKGSKLCDVCNSEAEKFRKEHGEE